MLNIESIRLINFRNYLNLNLQLNNKINVFIGKNAQGKTNFLEAIYLCATGRSFRTNSDRDMINFDKNEAYVGALMDVDNYKRFIEVKLERSNPKTIRINKNPLESNKELNSGLNVVVFSPDDLSLVKDGPAIRRGFLDREISQIRPVYGYNLRRYERILYQRNNILRSPRTDREKRELLEVFDLQLVKYGASLLKERQEYIKELGRIARLVHKNVTRSNEDMVLDYVTNIEVCDDLNHLEKAYLAGIRENLSKDIYNRTTALGPHRDDMKIIVNGKDLRVFGSQGQQRTAVLSIKLSEVELIRGERGSYPILLLDDVFSELDRERRKYLVKSLREIQTIITVIDAVNLEELEAMDKTVFKVDDGFIEEERYLL